MKVVLNFKNIEYGFETDGKKTPEKIPESPGIIDNSGIDQMFEQNTQSRIILFLILINNISLFSLEVLDKINPEHSIRFVYTPKHSSRMNQVEIWFSIITRRLLKRGSFHSVEHLERRILKFIEFFNKIMAKPFKWTYKGRPLTV